MKSEKSSGISHFARTNWRNQNLTFGIKREDRRRHFYVVGKTGMGKSTLLENLVAQDIHNGLWAVPADVEPIKVPPRIPDKKLSSRETEKKGVTN